MFTSPGSAYSLIVEQLQCVLCSMQISVRMDVTFMWEWRVWVPIIIGSTVVYSISTSAHVDVWCNLPRSAFSNGPYSAICFSISTIYCRCHGGGPKRTLKAIYLSYDMKAHCHSRILQVQARKLVEGYELDLCMLRRMISFPLLGSIVRSVDRYRMGRHSAQKDRIRKNRSAGFVSVIPYHWIVSCPSAV